MSSPYSSETNLLGTQKLKTAYLIAANDFMVGQLNANVLLQQPDLDIAELEPGLATAIRTFQERMKKNARFVLDKLIPDFIAILGKGANYSDLITHLLSGSTPELVSNAHKDANAARTVQEIASALANEAGQIGLTIETLTDDYAVSYQEIQRYATDYQQRMNEAIGLLGSSAKETSSEIDALQKAITESLNNIVKGGDEVGEGVSQLTGQILGALAKAAREPKPKTAPKKEKPKLKHDSDDPDQAYDEEDPNDSEDDYDSIDDVDLPDVSTQSNSVLEAIEVSRDGQTRVSEAVHTLRTTNARLADAYQELAFENGRMAIAKVIQVQNQFYLDGLEQMGAGARDLKQQWTAVEAAYRQLHQQAGTATDDAQAAQTGQAVQAATSLWKALGNQLNYVRETMTSGQ